MYVFKTEKNECVVVNKNESTVRQYTEGEQIGLLDFEIASRSAAFFTIVKEETIPQAQAKIKQLIGQDTVPMKIAKFEDAPAPRLQFAFWLPNTQS